MPSRHQRLVLVALGATGAVALALLASQWGAGVTTDSVRYIATARSMTAGEGLITHLDVPLVLHAPLYPTLLSLVERLTGVDPFASAHVVNAVLLGVLVYLSGVLLFRYLPGAPRVVYVTTGLIAVAMPIFKTSTMAWSEPLFIVLVLAFLIHLSRHLERGSVGPLLLASLFAALGCLTRYIGATLIVAGAAAILLSKRVDLRRRWRIALSFAIVSGVPLAAWAARNRLVAGTPFGDRPSSPYPLYRNLITAINTVLAWHVHWKVVWYGWVPLLAIGVVWSAVALYRRTTRPKALGYLRSVGPVALFVVAYWGSLAVASTLTAADEIGDRLMSPVFVPVLTLLLVFVREVAGKIAGRLPRLRPRHVLLIAAVLLMVYPTVLTGQFVGEYLERGGHGYNTDYWRGCRTVHHVIRSGLAEARTAVYSNGPAVVYFLTGKRTGSLPAAGAYNSPDVVGDLAEFEGEWPKETSAVLVWLDGVRRGYLPTVAELTHIARVAPLEQFDDGAVYQIGRKRR